MTFMTNDFHDFLTSRLTLGRAPNEFGLSSRLIAYFQGLSKLTGPFSSFWHTISTSS